MAFLKNLVFFFLSVVSILFASYRGTLISLSSTVTEKLFKERVFFTDSVNAGLAKFYVAFPYLADKVNLLVVRVMPWISLTQSSFGEPKHSRGKYGLSLPHESYVTK